MKTLTKALLILLVVFTLTGCLDSDWCSSSNGVRSKANRRISEGDYAVSWEFKFTSKGVYDISCRPRNIFSEFGLSFWTDLEYVGSEGDIKAFQGNRWRKPITVLVTPQGLAKVIEYRGDDTFVYTLSSEDARKFAIVYKNN